MNTLQQRITGQYELNKSLKLKATNLLKLYLELLEMTHHTIYVQYQKEFNDTHNVLLIISRNTSKENLEVGSKFLENLKETLRNHTEPLWYEFWK